jgi:predicted nucleic acid-binding protein
VCEPNTPIGSCRSRFRSRRAWGRFRARATLPVVDTFLVATALIHGLVVVSRDHSTAERVGVPWLDPWSA